MAVRAKACETVTMGGRAEGSARNSLMQSRNAMLYSVYRDSKEGDVHVLPVVCPLAVKKEMYTYCLLFVPYTYGLLFVPWQ